MTFLISMIFIFAFYVVPLRGLIISRTLIFPILGREGSWVATAGIIYVFMALGALALTQVEEVVWPFLPRWRRSLTSRVGIYRIDNFGFRLSVLATILFAATDITLVPLGVVAATGFASLTRKKLVVRKVGRDQNPEDSASGESEESRKNTDSEKKAYAERTYEWTVDEAFDQPFNGVLELKINKQRYEEFKVANPYREARPATRGYEQLVNDGITDEVKRLAKDLGAIASEQEFSGYQELTCFLAFVQAIPNEEGDSEKPYIRWPIETLQDMMGDSRSKSVLLAALLSASRHDVVIIEGKNRAGVGVAGAEGIPGRFLTYKGQRYYYCETSTTGWRVGQLPPDLSADQVHVYPLTPR